MIGLNQKEKEVAATSIWKAHVQQVLDKLKEEEACDTYGTEVVQEGEYEEDELQVDELLMAPSQMEDGQHEIQDPLEEINLGELENPKVVYVSKLLEEQLKQDLISMLKEYKDCFAWTYDDMPGLDRKLVEHRLPLKEVFKPFQQPSRRMSKESRAESERRSREIVKGQVYKTNQIYRMAFEHCASHEKEWQVARHELLSFMDGFSGYNQIKIADIDTPKTAFRCPGAVGTFEWLVMPFGLKNAGATYQRAMNSIFHDMIGHHIKVYIDDIVVKSKQAVDHIEHLRKSFQRMRQHELKLNPLKCAFGVKAGNFLGFLVHHRGVEVDKNKAKAIMEENPPRNKKELQRFLGQVNYLRRFISNLSGKTKEFSQLLKLKDSGEFKWEKSHQKAFDVIKRYLSNPLVLMPLRYGMPLKLYISAAHESIGCLLVQNNHEGNEQAIYYLSRFLTPVEVGFPVCGVGVQPWELKFDGSSTETAAGAGIVITSPRGVKTALSFNLDFPCTNNQAEYEALVHWIGNSERFRGKRIINIRGFSADTQTAVRGVQMHKFVLGS
ncbi:uncharacterized protein LOC142544201 [Primulina tabacum]|uniref:uncharacterized protein LOC142544201 n=1 Tax=Primulina tabacum TaxID=48773 RepID=UPI003F5960BD